MSDSEQLDYSADDSVEESAPATEEQHDTGMAVQPKAIAREKSPAAPAAAVAKSLVLQPGPNSHSTQGPLRLRSAADIMTGLQCVASHVARRRNMLGGAPVPVLRRWERDSTVLLLKAAKQLHTYTPGQQSSMAQRLWLLQQAGSRGQFCVIHGAANHDSDSCRQVRLHLRQSSLVQVLYAHPDTQGPVPSAKPPMQGSGTRRLRGQHMCSGRYHPYEHEAMVPEVPPYPTQMEAVPFFREHCWSEQQFHYEEPRMQRSIQQAGHAGYMPYQQPHMHQHSTDALVPTPGGLESVRTGRHSLSSAMQQRLGGRRAAVRVNQASVQQPFGSEARDMSLRTVPLPAAAASRYFAAPAGYMSREATTDLMRIIADQSARTATEAAVKVAAAEQEVDMLRGQLCALEARMQL